MRECDKLPPGSAARIARGAGVSLSYASRVLRGIQSPTLEVAKKMAVAAGMSLDEFVAAVTAVDKSKKQKANRRQ